VAEVSAEQPDAGRRRIGRFGASLARWLAPPAPERPQVAEQPPAAVLHLLRHLGVAMVRAGDPVDRVAIILDDVATTYAARGVRFFVLPTGVFVRIETGDDATQVDFAPASSGQLRLDQIDALYRLVDDIRHARLGVGEATARLDDLLASPPRRSAWVRVAGSAMLTVGLGLMLNPALAAVPAYLILGAGVGVLTVWAGRSAGVAVVLPVVASFAVTWAAFELARPTLDLWPLDVVIPPLVTLLPGAALTMATIELSAGSMLSGSARLVYGLQRLLLLAFGITLGIEVAGLPGHDVGAETLGPWAAWVGVLVFAVGHYLHSSVPGRSLPWLVLTLYVAYAAQTVAGALVGPLGGSFVAGVVLVPVAYAIQERPSGPPVAVTFLPTFWLLVPGALGLEGVTELVGADSAAGLGDFLNALLVIVAIAAGVLVGTGVSERFGRATGSWRGL
jgi:uncharacterized membrane protein YjjP (DUF1212 family)